MKKFKSLHTYNAEDNKCISAYEQVLVEEQEEAIKQAKLLTEQKQSLSKLSSLDKDQLISIIENLSKSDKRVLEYVSKFTKSI